MKAYGGSRVTTPAINLTIRWRLAVSFTARLLYPRVEAAVSIW